MISIKKAAGDLDRLDALLQMAAGSYEQALRAIAQYAVEVDPADTELFRKHLEGMQQQAQTAQTSEDWHQLRASLRGELREYRDRSVVHLGRLRADVRCAGEALQVFVESVSSVDSDHEKELKVVLKGLDSIANSSDLEKLQEGIRGASKSIAGSMEALQRKHQLAIGLMRDEIRLLHAQIHFAQNAQHLDRATGVWNRQKLNEQVSDLITQDQPFCVLLVCVRNLDRLGHSFSHNAIEASVKALLQRFGAMLEDGPMIGRWDERNFAALLRGAPGAAIQVSRLTAKKLSGEYSVQENGLLHSVNLQVVTGVIEHPAGTSDAPFQEKLEQMAHALAGA